MVLEVSASLFRPWISAGSATYSIVISRKIFIIMGPSNMKSGLRRNLTELQLKLRTRIKKEVLTEDISSVFRRECTHIVTIAIDS